MSPEIEPDTNPYSSPYSKPEKRKIFFLLRPWPCSASSSHWRRPRQSSDPKGLRFRVRGPQRALMIAA